MEHQCAAIHLVAGRVVAGDEVVGLGLGHVVVVLLLRLRLAFAAATNMSVVETDGPYAGYACHNASHAHHSGPSNSVQLQSRSMARIYTALRNAGLHVNAPDRWFTAGINKMGLG